MARTVHLIGSLPGTDARDAMTSALDVLGDHVRLLPDGETGERRNWIIHIVESLRDHPDLELAKEGWWTDYDDTPRFRVRKGHTLFGATLDLGHVAPFREGYRAFTQLREELGRSDLSFQVGIPGDFDLAMFALGPSGAVRNRRAFTEATLAEIHTIHREAGDDVVFQLEVPAELVGVARLPGRAQSGVAAFLAAGLHRMVQAAPAGARFGLHLCLGDMNHKAYGRMTDAWPAVHLTRALVRNWPEGRPLEYVHLPFAAAEDPPPEEDEWYAPLAELELPEPTRLVAGLVHEAPSVEAQRRLLDLVEDLVGGEVDVAASCGLGRRDRAAAVANLHRAVELVG